MPNHFCPSNELVSLKSKVSTMERQERTIHTLEAYANDLRRNVISVDTCLRELPSALGARIEMVGDRNAEA